jgi:hypothetical protein
MNLFNLFHQIMVKLGRHRLIPDRRTGEDYMDRYYIFLKDRKWFPFNATMHRIKKSDDPIFHDHPWAYLTIVLKGGYWEHTPVFNKEGKKIAEFSTWRGPGSVIMRKSNEYHWLELDESVGPATTLFFMGPQQRDWGFLIDKSKSKTQWIQWEHYLNNYKDYHTRYIEPKMSSMARKKD